jgi:hypothetical protein
MRLANLEPFPYLISVSPLVFCVQDTLAEVLAEKKDLLAQRDGLLAQRDDLLGRNAWLQQAVEFFVQVCTESP